MYLSENYNFVYYARIKNLCVCCLVLTYLRKVYSAGAIPGIGVYGSWPGEVEMAQMLKALTQRFQRHQLTDYPNQVKVSDHYGDSSPGFCTVLCACCQAKPPYVLV